MSDSIKQQLMEMAKQRGGGNIFPCSTFEKQKSWDECFDIIPEMHIAVLYFNVENGSTLLVKVAI